VKYRHPYYSATTNHLCYGEEVWYPKKRQKLRRGFENCSSGSIRLFTLFLVKEFNQATFNGSSTLIYMGISLSF